MNRIKSGRDTSSTKCHGRTKMGGTKIGQIKMDGTKISETKVAGTLKCKYKKVMAEKK